MSSVALAAVIAAGCQSSASDTTVNKRVQPEYDPKGRLTKLTYDRDGDGKIDTWGYMDGSRVVRVEVDDNGDGKVDRWEYHKDTAGGAGKAGANGSMGSTGSMGSMGSTGSNGSTGSAGSAGAAEGGVDVTLERIERSTRHDGVVSRREFFDNGVLTRVEEDTDGNGKIDKWETYSGGTLAVMELDTKGRGKPDRRLIYQADGSLSRIEADPNGTGTFQTISR